MVTNTALVTAITEQVAAFGIAQSLPVAYPERTFKSKGIDRWLELAIAPDDYDPFLSGTNDIKRGMFQINVSYRPGVESLTWARGIADSIVTTWPKARTITGTVRVTQTPYVMKSIPIDDRVILPVVIQYHQ